MPVPALLRVLPPSVRRGALLGGLACGVALALAAAPAAAQSAGQKKGDAACAAYGPDFQKAPGSDSCVRMRSGVQADAFGAKTLTNAPNQGFGPASLGTSDGSAAAVPDPWKAAR